MIAIITQIRKLAVDMRTATSVNDIHREKLQAVIDLCDKATTHFIDDGR